MSTPPSLLRPREAAGVPGRDRPPTAGRDATPPEPMVVAGTRWPARTTSTSQREGACATCSTLTEPLGAWGGTSCSASAVPASISRTASKSRSRCPLPRSTEDRFGDGRPLNTHTPASLYEAFPPEEAKRLADRLEEIHYAPKHGSWPNMAEIELS